MSITTDVNLLWNVGLLQYVACHRSPHAPVQVLTAPKQLSIGVTVRSALIRGELADVSTQAVLTLITHMYVGVGACHFKVLVNLFSRRYFLRRLLSCEPPCAHAKTGLMTFDKSRSEQK